MPAPKPANVETQNVVTSLDKSGDVAPELQKVLQPASEEVLRESIGPVGAVSCHRGGCYAKVNYPDVCTIQRATRAAIETPTSRLLKWPGGVYKSPAVQLADGSYEVTWVLLVSTLEPGDDAGRKQPLLDRQLTRLTALASKQPLNEPPAILKPDVCRPATDGPILRGPANAPTSAPSNPQPPVAK